MNYQTPSHFNIEIRIISDNEERIKDCHPRKDVGCNSSLENVGENGILQGSIPGCVPEPVEDDIDQTNFKSTEELDKLIHPKDGEFHKELQRVTKSAVCQGSKPETLDCESIRILGGCITKL
jgi:hypothetical protein